MSAVYSGCTLTTATAEANSIALEISTRDHGLGSHVSLPNRLLMVIILKNEHESVREV